MRPAVRELRPYHIEDAAGLIKLDAMENPHPWPAELRGAFVEALRSVEPNRYPDGEARALKQRLRGYLGLSDDTGLLLGNGSDELIQMIGLTVGGPGRCLLCPEPSFSMYRILAAVTGMRYVGVPLRGRDFDLDHEAMLRAIDRHRPAVVVLSYPNNPTGNLFERRLIEAVIEASPGLVLIDEAYFDFSGETLLDWVTGRPRVLVLRTLSKIGLAGLRVGFLIGDPSGWPRSTRYACPTTSAPCRRRAPTGSCPMPRCCASRRSASAAIAMPCARPCDVSRSSRCG